MKVSLFLGALAALPSLISAFSTYEDLYTRDIEDEYDTTLSIRDDIPGSGVYDRSYGLAMRSLEARFADVAHEIAHSIASRDFLEARSKYGKQKTAAERQHSDKKAQYNQANGNQAATNTQKSQAAQQVSDAATKVANIRQKEVDRVARKLQRPLTQQQDTDRINHENQVSNWRKNAETWQATANRHLGTRSVRRSIDELEFLDILSMF